MRPGPRATPQKEELSGRVDNTPPRARNRAVNLRLLGTLLLGHLTTDLAQGMIPALLAFFIAERGLSYAAAGGPVLAATVASSIVQPVFGYFADRRPSPWLVPAGVVTAGVGVALAGVAPSYSLIAASVALHGLGVAAFHPEGARAAAFASGTKRATGMSLFSTGGNLGMATGPLVITPLVLAFGLRATLAPLLPVVLVAAFLSTQTGRLAALRPHAHGPASAATDADRWGPFGRLAVVVMSRSVVYTGISSFLPLFFAGVLGRTKAEGATALSILLGTGVVGTLAGGRLADRWGVAGPLFVVSALPLLAVALTLPDSRAAEERA